jgi:hypothetical protein
MALLTPLLLIVSYVLLYNEKVVLSVVKYINRKVALDTSHVLPMHSC